MNNYAPVLIPTLNRHVHLKRCVNTLSKCTDADKTDLYVALDYPLNEPHWEGYRIIKEYLPTVTGFKSVTIIEREKNFGVPHNLDHLVSHVIKLHDKFILSEDDNEFSPNFLVYLNSCLKKYGNDERVISISGYNRRIDMGDYKYNIYAANNSSTYGAGILRENYQCLRKHVINLEFPQSIVKSWKKSYKIYKFSPFLLQSLMGIVNKKKTTSDVLILSYMILNEKYGILPSISKVRNHGFDGGGEHYADKPDHPMLTQVIDKSTSFEPDDIEIKENELIRKKTMDYFNAQLSLFYRLLFKTYITIRYIIYRFTGRFIYR